MGGVGVDDNQFSMVATGTVQIPTAGYWTFDVNHDDGFSLWFQGNGLDYTYQNVTGTTEAFVQVNFPVVGSYNMKSELLRGDRQREHRTGRHRRAVHAAVRPECVSSATRPTAAWPSGRPG